MVSSGWVDSTNTLNHRTITSALGTLLIPWWWRNSPGLNHVPQLPSIWGMMTRISIRHRYLNLDIHDHHCHSGHQLIQKVIVERLMKYGMMFWGDTGENPEPRVASIRWKLRKLLGRMWGPRLIEDISPKKSWKARWVEKGTIWIMKCGKMIHIGISEERNKTCVNLEDQWK